MLVKQKVLFVKSNRLMRYSLAAFFLLTGLAVSAQTVLNITGQTYTNSDETWLGVNISRSVPTNFVFRNNSITSSNTLGYMLQAGDEGITSTNKNLNGAVITGNKFSWKGTDMKSITHGLFTGNNINVNIKYNYLDYVPMGIILKSSSNMVNSTGGVAYNIVKSGGVAVNIKGISNVSIYNNTLYTDRTTSETWRGLVRVYTNTDISPISVANGTKVFNNIFYTKYQTISIQISDAESLKGFESDYNIFYCENGSPIFDYCGSIKTFQQWQALGYDTHSRVVNPNFKDFVYFVPSARLDYGTNLGATWAEGLSVNAKWGTTDPEKALQNGQWQVGAVIYKEATTPAPVIQIPVYSGSVINDATPARIEMTFNLALASIVPAPSAFSVTVNSSSRSVSAVSVSGTKVLLTLASQVSYGDRITVAYTKPATNPLQTSAGGQAASLTAQTVTNNRTAPVNSPPLITISSPTKSTAFIAPATITIDASASDPDGTVTKVEFFNGTVKLGERTTAPWSFAWKEVKEGTYNITAAATDNLNAISVSTLVTVVVEKSTPAVNQAPSITISAPQNSDSFVAPAAITLTAVASDPDGSVIRVEYYLGNIILGESTTPPFSFYFQSDTSGIFEIRAIAYDNLNATTTSAPIVISLSVKRVDPGLVNLYPSPNNGVFAVDINQMEEFQDELRLTILSLEGRTVYSDLLPPGEIIRNIDISDSLPGIYILKITDTNGIITTRRFVKY